MMILLSVYIIACMVVWVVLDGESGKAKCAAVLILGCIWLGIGAVVNALA